MAFKVYLSNEIEEIFAKLTRDVAELRARDPRDHPLHPKTKLLYKLQKAISDVIRNPDAPEFRLGMTLGAEFSDWRRVKRDLPSRYRLFFRFFSESEEIFFVWINDETSIRRAGSRRDVYEVFKGKLKRGEFPNDKESLLKRATEHDEPIPKPPSQSQ